MQFRVVALYAVSLLLCSEASAQNGTIPGSDVPVRKEIAVRKEPEPPCAPTVSAPVPLLGTSLIQVFDTADFATRRSILTMVPRLTGAEQRRELLLSGLRHGGSREGAFIGALAALIALQLGDEGRAILRHALSRHMVRDERTRLTVLAALETR